MEARAVTARAPTRPAPRAATLLSPPAVLSLLYAALVLPLIFAQRGDRSLVGAKDQESFHLPTIIDFAHELPGIDLEGANTATGPGFQLVLSLVARFVSEDRVVLQLAGAVISLLLVLSVYRVAGRFVDRWLACLMTLPVLLSSYVLQSSVYLLADNSALLFVTLALGGALSLSTAPGRLALTGAAAAAAVAIRQIHLWLIAPIVLAAAIGGRVLERRDPGPVVRAVLAAVPAVTVVAALVVTWGGFTPPGFQGVNAGGFSPSVVALTLSLTALFGSFYLFAVTPIRPLLRDPAIPVAAVSGAATALLVPTAASADAGRTGGALWEVVAKAPVVADRSPVLVVLAACGAVVLLGLWRAAGRVGRRQEALVLLAALAAALAAQAATNFAYQRYVEPLTLIMLVLLSAVALADSAGGHVTRRAMLAMLVLAAIQLTGAAVGVYADAITSPALERLAR
jgi:hypothetical protein